MVRAALIALVIALVTATTSAAAPASAPSTAARFVGRIEEIVGGPANVVGVGPARAESISRGHFWRN